MGHSQEHAGVLEWISLCLSVIVFLVCILACVITLKKIDFRVEKSLLVVLSLYTLSTFINMLAWILYFSHDTYYAFHKIDITDTLCELAYEIIFTILYYFAFEMKDLKNKLESNTVQEYAQKTKWWRIFRALAMGFNILVSVICIIISIYLGFIEFDISKGD